MASWTYWTYQGGRWFQRYANGKPSDVRRALSTYNVRLMDQEQIEALKSQGPGTLMEKMGFEWLEASSEKAVGRMPVEGNTQPYGLLHGGASACLAETLASVGAWLADPSMITMGIEITVNHIKAATSGWITGTAVPLRQGKSVAVWEIRMTNDDGELTAFSTCTIAIKKAR